MPNLKWALTMTAVAALFLFVRPAHAATITVSTTVDDLTVNGNCTLREAIKSANTDSAIDTCTAGFGTDTIILGTNVYDISILGPGENSNATGDFDITTNIIIQGTGRTDTVIESDGVTFNDRIFDISALGTLSLSNLAIAGGNATANGGAILNSGSLTMTSVELAFNTTTADGGAIATAGSSTTTALYVNVYLNSAANGGGIKNSGTLTFTQGFIGVNSADQGGGFDNAATATIRNSTITENFTSVGNGGGGRNESTGTLTLDSDTIDSNTAITAPGGLASIASGTVNMQRTIISNNFDNSAQTDCSGSINSQDYNLVQVTTGCSLTGTTTHNLLGSDPMVDSNFVQGGNGVFAEPLIYGSPAIDSAGASCLATDAINTSRPQRGTHGPSALCDRGAFEYIIDETAPVVTASVNVGAVTTNNRPTFTITSNENGTVVYSCDPFNSPSGLVSSVGRVSANIATPDQIQFALNDVTYSCRVTVMDVAQNIGSSSTMVFRIDTHAPVLSAPQGPLLSNTGYATLQITWTEDGTLQSTGDCPTPYSTNRSGSQVLYNYQLADGVYNQCSYTMTDAAGNVSAALTPSITVDTQRPVAFKIGGSTVDIGLGQTYNDLGAVAYDLHDSAIGTSPSITRLGTVDTSRAGIYDISYAILDSTGNAPFPGAGRHVVVRPKVNTLTSKSGKVTASINGTSKTFQPFSGYTGPIYSRQVIYGPNATDQRFLFVPTTPNKKANKILWLDNAGKKVSTYDLPSTLNTVGLNIDNIFETKYNKFLLAIAGVKSDNQPLVLTITSSSLKKITTQKVSKTVKGNVAVKFVPLGNDSSVLVAGVNGQKSGIRAWSYNGVDMGENTNTAKRVTQSAKGFTIIAPAIRNVEIYANPSGRVVFNWKTTIPANYKIEYGPGYSLGSSVNGSLVASSQQQVITIPSNTTFQYKITACNPKVSSSVGCATYSGIFLSI